MKKIIAVAVVSAFVTPAFAADVSVNGLVEFAFTDNNGTTSTGNGDNAIYVSASTETSNGLAVSADINITGNGENDGGDSLTIAGPFGTVDLGDTSSATDKFDDRTDKDVMVGGVGVGGQDAGASWQLPTLVPGLTTYISYGADSNADGEAHTGVGLEYGAGPVEVAFAQNQADDETKDQTYVGGTVTFAGVALSYDRMDTGTDDSDLTETAVGLTYSMNDLTFAVTSTEKEDAAGLTTSDVMFYGVKYSLGGGVTAFAETYADDVDTDDEATAIGVAFSF